ncbi:hypothetical protein QYM36_008736 [Artemia franciscana]|uniref:Uncharacterized protein n=1 Tax=Artemia franciscana TaxID=6661 RepID=A0AA88HPU1_ARTSF|nr:hypothetical protein QYM36_008736 [Artemia franciscana]
MIHLDLARYHELSRFSSPGDEYDKTAALFHLRRAADCGVLEAVIASARIYLQLPHNILEDIDLPFSLEHEDIGLDYMTYAAEAGDRAAMIFLAKVYDTGLNLGTRVRSWTEAVRLYSKAVAALTEMDDDGHFDGTMDDPQYQLIARQAEMYRDGGFGLEINYAKADWRRWVLSRILGKSRTRRAKRNQELLREMTQTNGWLSMLSAELFSTAADDAMESMKGRIASKYYELAEEMSALAEEA